MASFLCHKPESRVISMLSSGYCDFLASSSATVLLTKVNTLRCYRRQYFNDPIDLIYYVISARLLIYKIAGKSKADRQ